MGALPFADEDMAIGVQEDDADADVGAGAGGGGHSDFLDGELVTGAGGVNKKWRDWHV